MGGKVIWSVQDLMDWRALREASGRQDLVCIRTEPPPEGPGWGHRCVRNQDPENKGKPGNRAIFTSSKNLRYTSI